MSVITKDVVEKIARLAKLDLSDAEITKFTSELDSILSHVKEIAEVDVSDVDDASHLDDFQGEVMAEDVPLPGWEQDSLLENATDGRAIGSAFVTSQIVV